MIKELEDKIITDIDGNKYGIMPENKEIIEKINEIIRILNRDIYQKEGR